MGKYYRNIQNIVLLLCCKNFYFLLIIFYFMKLIRNRDFLQNQNSKLFIEKVSAEKLAKKFSTPLYVYSETRIRANIQRIKQALKKYIPESRLFYAVKSNNNLSVQHEIVSVFRQD